MRIKIDNESGHHFFEEWEKTLLFCPDCGEKTVWEQQGMGDYYIGNPWMCVSCGTEFHCLRQHNGKDFERTYRMKLLRGDV